jgi:hypothetical protein
MSSKLSSQPASKTGTLHKIVFEPSLLDFEPISVSKDDPSTLSEPSKEVLPKTVDFIGIRLSQDLIVTSKSTRNYLSTSFLKTLTSETYMDRATLGFIVDAIGDSDNACLWLNARCSIEGCDIPKSLSIHLFANTTAKQILSHEVHSMIIQSSDPSEPYPNIYESLSSLFYKASFTGLKCLMLYGFLFLGDLSLCIKKLNLEAFHMAKFRYGNHLGTAGSLQECNTLERLYVVHPDVDMKLFPPSGLKKLLIHYSEPRENVITGTKPSLYGLVITIHFLQDLEEM